MPDKDSITSRLPEGFISLGFIAAVKCLDGEGNIALATIESEALPPWEAYGMLLTAAEDFKPEMNAYHTRDDD